MQERKSWILKTSRYFNSVGLRDKIIGGSFILGSGLSNWLINFGYLIKCSKFFYDSKIPVNAGRIKHYGNLSKNFSLDKKDLLYLEFGVYRGESFRYWLEENKNINSKFIGFDTFSGLPEDWGHLKKGHFDTEGNIPKYDDNRYIFIKGLFQETLPVFIEENQDLLKKPMLVNLDADLYTSTLYTLIQLGPYLKKGDILAFDEFFSVVNASTEFRAFIDFITISGLDYSVVSKSTTHCAIKVK